MHSAYQGLGHRKLLVIKFMSEANSVKDAQKRIYVTATPSSKKILKNVGFVFEHHQVDTGDKTLFTFSSGICVPKEGERVVRDTICLNIH